jgi:hypothetical protein
VRVTRRKRSITVRWKPVPGASRYEVLITLTDGSKVFRIVRATHARLPDPFPAKLGTALVNALAVDNTRGAAATARIRPGARTPHRRR